jgi:hypothetical protein
MADSSHVTSQAIPAKARPLLGTLLRVLGGPPGIYVPLLKDGSPAGMLNLVGRGLLETDIPAVRRLAEIISEKLYL